MDRTTMSPGSGKMLKSDNTELDVATLLEALEDAVDAIQTASEAVQAAVEGTLTAELSGSLASVSDTITRPDDTAPYTGGGMWFPLSPERYWSLLRSVRLAAPSQS